mgnify:CR=1 FL=1
MVTRAKILEIISDMEIKIEVPAFGLIEELEGEEEVNEMPTARICTVPGCYPNFEEGDIILICIEDNDLSNPMIMGRLIPDDGSLGTSNGTFQNLTVEKDTVLAKETTIGEVTSGNIEQLYGANYNLQGQLDTNIAQRTELLDFISETLDEVEFK